MSSCVVSRGCSQPQRPGRSTATKIPLEVPCRICGQTVRTNDKHCPHCGTPDPAQGAIKASGFEWKTEAEWFGYPLVHIATGRDANGKLRVAKGVIAIGQYAIGAFALAQFGVAFIFGLGQFMAGPIVIGQAAIGIIFGLGQLATGYAAIGQLAIGYYVIGQTGFAYHFYGPSRHDPMALEFFRSWAEKIGIHIFK